MVLHWLFLPLTLLLLILALHPSSACTPDVFYSEAYLGFKGNELQNHLHSEEAGEEHVEDVHGDFKQAALTVVLSEGKNCENEAGVSLLLTTLISTEVFLEPSTSWKSIQFSVGSQVDSGNLTSSFFLCYLQKQKLAEFYVPALIGYDNFMENLGTQKSWPPWRQVDVESISTHHALLTIMNSLSSSSLLHFLHSLHFLNQKAYGFLGSQRRALPWKRKLVFLYLGEEEGSSVFQHTLATREVTNQRYLSAPLHSIFSHSILPHAGIKRPRPPWTNLHGQADGVEQDEDEHQVLKVGGVDHIPHFVLVLVLGYVPPQGPGFEGIFYTLTLGGRLWGMGMAEMGRECG